MSGCGCANQAGEDNRNVARMSSLLAGLPVTGRGNGQSPVRFRMDAGLRRQGHQGGDRAGRCRWGRVHVAGTFVMGKATAAYSRDAQLYDTTIGWRFVAN